MKREELDKDLEEVLKLVRDKNQKGVYWGKDGNSIDTAFDDEQPKIMTAAIAIKERPLMTTIEIVSFTNGYDLGCEETHKRYKPQQDELKRLEEKADTSFVDVHIGAILDLVITK